MYFHFRIQKMLYIFKKFVKLISRAKNLSGATVEQFKKSSFFKQKNLKIYTKFLKKILHFSLYLQGDSMQDSAQLKKIQPRQPRVKFTNAQRDYLNKCFECNPKPSQGKHL